MTTIQSALPLKVLTIRGFNWTMNIALDVMVERYTLEEIQKVLKWMMEDFYQNEEAFTTLDDWFIEAETLAKQAWTTASQEFSNGWKDVSQYHRHLKKEIRRENDRLTDQVKYAKRIYERACKIHDLLKAHAAKYQIKLH